MKPLFVLIVAFGICLLITHLLFGGCDLQLAGNISMSGMLLFTAIGHFAYTSGRALMLPQRIPFKKTLVYITGFIEIAAAIGLLLQPMQVLTGVLLMLFFLLMLPCNIYAALHRVDYQKGTYNGPGPVYLWFRVPMQLFLMAWVYFFNLFL